MLSVAPLYLLTFHLVDDVLFFLLESVSGRLECSLCIFGEVFMIFKLFSQTEKFFSEFTVLGLESSLLTKGFVCFLFSLINSLIHLLQYDLMRVVLLLLVLLTVD